MILPSTSFREIPGQGMSPFPGYSRSMMWWAGSFHSVGVGQLYIYNASSPYSRTRNICKFIEVRLLCDTTPRRASVATNGLWRVAARAWHKPPADACSVVSAHPSHLDR